MIRINNTYIDDTGFTDFVRINDTKLICLNNSKIHFLDFKPVNQDIINKIIPKSTPVLTKVFDNCNFTSLLKLTDDSFAVAGSKDSVPAVYIISQSGNVLDSIIMEGRKGVFNYMSFTPDKKILLSGYRIIPIGTKVPYFVKTKNQYSIGDNNNPGVTNPTPTDGKAGISFVLTNKSDVKLSIYDLSGRLLHASQKEYQPGEHTIDYDFSIYSGNMFIYILEYEGKTVTGKVLYYR